MLENADVVMGILPLWLGLLLGGGLGAVKHFAADAPIAEKQRKIQGATTRYSPWTGMKAPEPSQPNLFSSVFQGGLAGANFAGMADKAGLFSEAAPAAAATGGASKFNLQSLFDGPKAEDAMGIARSGGRMLPGMTSYWE